MRKRKKKLPVLHDVMIIDTGAKGKAVGKIGDQVVFIPFVVPGDEVDVQVTRKRKNHLEGRAIAFHHYSERRTEPVCQHFGLCGGCKWQNMKYEDQLHFKQKLVEDSLRKIAKVDIDKIRPILPSGNKFFYRNKLEFTFSNRKWFTDPNPDPEVDRDSDALGFHMPGMFDRVLDIEKCHLQNDLSNKIRLSVRGKAKEMNLSFYDAKKNTGLLRNLIIRNSSLKEWMVIVVFAYQDKENISLMMDHLSNDFPEINSLMYVVNEKKNDDISDQKVILYQGNPYINEALEAFEKDKPPVKFRIGPLSFFQTNTAQAANLYRTAANLAEFKGHEVVYDLYSGTGTITNYIAGSVKLAIGIESIGDAVRDAFVNATVNGIENTDFVCGDMVDVFNEEFIKKYGSPDVVITDPPRAGMHPKVIERLKMLAPEKIVYVSCNPATQARDLEILKELYEVTVTQPVDMFPHTQHVENVALLVKKSGRD